MRGAGSGPLSDAGKVECPSPSGTTRPDGNRLMPRKQASALAYRRSIVRWKLTHHFHEVLRVRVFLSVFEFD
jgi:hypothetical protein